VTESLELAGLVAVALALVKALEKAWDAVTASHHKASDEQERVEMLKDLQEAAQKREDTLRRHYEERLDRERDQQKAIMRELNETLKGYEE
jgi:uncharacterized protein YPO0396